METCNENPLPDNLTLLIVVLGKIARCWCIRLSIKAIEYLHVYLHFLLLAVRSASPSPNRCLLPPCHSWLQPYGGRLCGSVIPLLCTRHLAPVFSTPLPPSWSVGLARAFPRRLAPQSTKAPGTKAAATRGPPPPPAAAAAPESSPSALGAPPFPRHMDSQESPPFPPYPPTHAGGLVFSNFFYIVCRLFGVKCKHFLR